MDVAQRNHCTCTYQGIVDGSLALFTHSAAGESLPEMNKIGRNKTDAFILKSFFDKMAEALCLLA